jgi:hypothetical protein
MNPLNIGCGHLDMAGMTYANVITTKYQKKLLATFYTNWRRNMRTMSGMNMTDAKCYECGRIFDLLNDNDADEWHYGHDCEA